MTYGSRGGGTGGSPGFTSKFMSSPGMILPALVVALGLLAVCAWRAVLAWQTPGGALAMALWQGLDRLFGTSAGGTFYSVLQLLAARAAAILWALGALVCLDCARTLMYLWHFTRQGKSQAMLAVRAVFRLAALLLALSALILAAEGVRSAVRPSAEDAAVYRWLREFVARAFTPLPRVGRRLLTWLEEYRSALKPAVCALGVLAALLLRGQAARMSSYGGLRGPVVHPGFDFNGWKVRWLKRFHWLARLAAVALVAMGALNVIDGVPDYIRPVIQRVRTSSQLSGGVLDKLNARGDLAKVLEWHPLILAVVGLIALYLLVFRANSPLKKHLGILRGGIEGEDRALRLMRMRLPARSHVFSSVHLPGGSAYKSYETDLIAVTTGGVWLVEVKNYRAQDAAKISAAADQAHKCVGTLVKYLQERMPKDTPWVRGAVMLVNPASANAQDYASGVPLYGLNQLNQLWLQMEAPAPGRSGLTPAQVRRAARALKRL